jgi:predicted DNA-binding protein (MmcQ/YjbR family)
LAILTRCEIGGALTYEYLNAFCKALPVTTYVVQWGGAHVWKVGGKVFAIGGWAESGPAVTFNVTEIAFELLNEQPGLRPAPYLASRCMKWMQNYAEPGLTNSELQDYVLQSHDLVARGLTEKEQKELGGEQGL